VWAIGTELDKTVKSIEQKRIRDTDQGGAGLNHYDDNSKVMIVGIPVGRARGVLPDCG
jgi:hypothetical protein